MSLLRALRPQPARLAGSPSSPHLSIIRNSLRRQGRRFESTNTPPGGSKPATASAPSLETQPDPASIGRIQRLLPKRFHKHLAQFRSSPFSHITAFLVLHEITAIAPIIGLTTAFYYFDVVPTEYVFGPWAGYASEAVGTWLKYARKKGWFGLGKADNREGEERLEREIKEDAARLRAERGEAEPTEKGGQRGIMTRLAFWRRGKSEEEALVEADKDVKQRSMAKKAVDVVREKVTWNNTEKGYKISVQLVAAYAITKMLLYPRLAFSLWLTPSFARVMVRTRKAVFGR
jgi:hypothetical protein